MPTTSCGCCASALSIALPPAARRRASTQHTPDNKRSGASVIPPAPTCRRPNHAAGPSERPPLILCVAVCCATKRDDRETPSRLRWARGRPRALAPRVIISHTVKRDERETPAGFNPACRIGSCGNAAILRSHALFADSSVPAHSITRRPNQPCCANATAAIGWPGGAITDLSSSRPIFIDRHINHQPPCYPG
jgi:hypothetical protein